MKAMRKMTSNYYYNLCHHSHNPIIATTTINIIIVVDGATKKMMVMIMVFMDCVWPCFCLDVSKSRITYLLQVGRYSLLPLQDQEMMSGQQDRIAITPVPLISLLSHRQNKRPSQGTLVTEGLVLILFLDLVLLITHPWLWGTWYCLQ